MYSDQQKMWRVFSASPVDSRLARASAMRGWQLPGLVSLAGWRQAARRFLATEEREHREKWQHHATSDFFHELFRRVRSSLNKTSTTVAMTKIVLRAFSCGLRPTFAIP